MITKTQSKGRSQKEISEGFKIFEGVQVEAEVHR
jgi:hypothetical protein